ncbi:hypothetical protein JTE90_026984 [Oedothorax gibbosus]|uniref:Uncharacterized protein n=1 Tax=Oedothorax gibbosus TaxID=931172 RepID=A0AAV6TUI4_9ARAC|nr:hypothetical protein JTE90_026984 [Oedothorax gibbosus]
MTMSGYNTDGNHANKDDFDLLVKAVYEAPQNYLESPLIRQSNGGKPRPPLYLNSHAGKPRPPLYLNSHAGKPRPPLYLNSHAGKPRPPLYLNSHAATSRRQLYELVLHQFSLSSGFSITAIPPSSSCFPLSNGIPF